MEIKIKMDGKEYSIEKTKEIYDELKKIFESSEMREVYKPYPRTKISYSPYTTWLDLFGGK